MTADRFQLTQGSTELKINNLGSNDTNCRLIATLRKTNVSTKKKLKEVVGSVILSASSNKSSGTGQNTLNDGLIYDNYPYGTRIQDEEIVLSHPDIVEIHAIYESINSSDPESPYVSLSDLSGSTRTTADLIVGEKIVGRTSGAIAKHLGNINDNQVRFEYLNDNVFLLEEILDFETSSTTAKISELVSISNNITSSFTLDKGQKSSHYDYSKLIRKPEVDAPTKKIKVFFSRAYFDVSDTGDITTVESYSAFDYGKEIETVNGIRTTDMVDVRPRVSTYTLSAGSRSPFEFLGRSFSGGAHSSPHVISKSDSLSLNYSYFLPRYDSIFVDKKGVFSVVSGTSKDDPKILESVPGSMRVADIFLPAYLYSVSDAEVSFINHKRYQMQDISKLERRINNLEYYTSLNILEQKTINQFTPDENGLNRFKSGIAVDNFHSRDIQDPRVGVKNAIDKSNHILRPSHYTTAINLNLATEGNSNDDTRFSTIIGDGIRRTNQVISLDYSEVSWLNQPFATRTESVTPFLVTFYQGQLSFEPTVDVWIDTITIEPRNIQGGVTTTDLLPVNVEINRRGNNEDAPRVGPLPAVINDDREADLTKSK